MESVSAFPDRAVPLAAFRPTPEELCELYAQRVYQFAAMMCAGDAEAEDLAQEALLRAITRLHQYDPARGPLEAWLWRIVANVARDAGRGMKRRHALLERLHARTSMVEVMEEDVAEGLSDEDLIASVRALDARARTLISLRFGADLEYAAIGSLLGISSDAARMATGRALAVLRRRLQQECPS